MEQDTINNQILNELKQLRIDINIIKQNTINSDTILTDNEEKEISKALEEYEKGETFSLEDVERERSKNTEFEIQ